MIEHLPTNTVVELELADGTKLTDLRTNGNNFVSDTPIEDSAFEGNLSAVKITTPEGVTEYKDLNLVQNRLFGDVYMFILSEYTPAEKEKEERLQLIADLAELTLEVASDG